MIALTLRAQITTGASLLLPCLCRVSAATPAVAGAWAAATRAGTWAVIGRPEPPPVPVACAWAGALCLFGGLVLGRGEVVVDDGLRLLGVAVPGFGELGEDGLEVSPGTPRR
ncbi:hypothetical protein BJF84_08525 [Rhodococcus sp. CUA-806]|nr:hypothetical protein BJF84_08525 [Rhodococcus sp. CUA-806]